MGITEKKTRNPIVRECSIDAFEELIDQYQVMLYRIGVNLLRSDKDTADAIRTTLTAAYTYRHRLKEDEHFKIWLVNLLMNECKKILRNKEKVRRKRSKAYNQEKNDNDVGQDEFTPYLAKMNFKLQQVMVLKYYGGFKIHEIKEVLKIPECIVKIRLRNAKEKLFLLMNEEGEI